MLIVYHAFRRLGIPFLLGLKGPSSAFANSSKAPCGKVCLSSALHGGQQSIREEIPPDFPRRDDVLAALNAVRQGCRITQALQPLGSRPGVEEKSKASEETIATVEKADLSPVTVADYAVQALILHLLHTEFPEDGFIAEEDSAALLENESLLSQVLSATGLARKEDMLQGLDLGKSYTKWSNGEKNTSSRPPRVWALDPIDGTRGFLRGKTSGGQYAVALALIENGKPVIGVLGCPNLPTGMNDENYAWNEDETEDRNKESRGCVFVASRGGGCYQLPLHPVDSVLPKKLSVTPNDGSTRKICDGRFSIGVEKFSDALGQTAGMAKVLHGSERALDDDGEIIRARRIDSQAKHGVIARGGAEWYVRLPKPGYVEWIWDHAAGNVVIEEAGGKMTDTEDCPLDFSLGPKLSPSVRGILMSNGGEFHRALVDAFAQEEKLRLEHSGGDK
jgi:3'(2'), 5'-bisphosphate nucleotidase